MTFGSSFKSMLQRGGYSLISEFCTTHRRMAVRLRVDASDEIIVMYHSDAVELARGATTAAAIARRNRSVIFGEELSSTSVGRAVSATPARKS
jgi:hypothetical protein